MGIYQYCAFLYDDKKYKKLKFRGLFAKDCNFMCCYVQDIKHGFITSLWNPSNRYVRRLQSVKLEQTSDCLCEAHIDITHLRT